MTFKDTQFFLKEERLVLLLERFLLEKNNKLTFSTQYKLYYLLRPFIPIFVRQFLQKTKDYGEISENWFMENKLFPELAKLTQGKEFEIPYFWKDKKNFAFVSTHDVEEQEGFDKIAKIADLEEKLGFRSSWTLVAKKYEIDKGLVSDLQKRGFEIGIHGYNHDGKLYFSKSTFDKRAKLINEKLTELGAVGFRSPQMHRNLDWISQLKIDYDLSTFDVDPYQPIAGGTHSIFPFCYKNYVEMPYTLPQDHTVFITLNSENTNIWIKKTKWLVKNHALVLLNTHPDYLDTEVRLNAYLDYLKFLKNEMEGMWNEIPKVVASWWKFREGLGTGFEKNTVSKAKIRFLADGIELTFIEN
ncbi:hypothetical protein IT568_02555 [bacterium]|nr:hypothetical protein [bacterium]